MRTKTPVDYARPRVKLGSFSAFLTLFDASLDFPYEYCGSEKVCATTSRYVTGYTYRPVYRNASDFAYFIVSTNLQSDLHIGFSSNPSSQDQIYENQSRCRV